VLKKSLRESSNEEDSEKNQNEKGEIIRQRGSGKGEDVNKENLQGRTKQRKKKRPAKRPGGPIKEVLVSRTAG